MYDHTKMPESLLHLIASMAIIGWTRLLSDGYFSAQVVIKLQLWQLQVAAAALGQPFLLHGSGVTQSINDASTPGNFGDLGDRVKLAQKR